MTHQLEEYLRHRRTVFSYSLAQSHRHLYVERSEMLRFIHEGNAGLAACCAVEAYRWARHVWLQTDRDLFAWSVQVKTS